MKLTAIGLAQNAPAPLAFTDTVLRGLGQVMLQDNAYAGLLFLAGIFWNSRLFGCAALVGTIVGTTTALMMGAARDQVRQGLFGFNGALVGIALLYFLDPSPLAWGFVVVAAACSTVLMAALMNAFSTWKAPALTAPFVLTSLLFLLACARFGRLHSTGVLPTAGLPRAAEVEGLVTGATLLQGLFNGLGQIFFQGSLVTGALFALGLLVSSRKAFAAALLGSFAGALVAWGLGAAEPAIRAGAYGFNPALTAIALGSVFFAASRASAIYAALGTIATTVVFAGLSAALEPLGMPALTAPFVIVVWLFVLAGPLFPKLKTPGTST